MSLNDALTKDYEPYCESEKIESWARLEMNEWLKILSDPSVIENDLLILRPLRTLVTTACIDIE